ncbi:hypothetical protein BCR43DRAFT_519021 [Syncephalastrum racemosum]|uniref:Uncharacterized protein n=1 Tax=Syncephalastrum racemosum TaxID=13706 RepID=A0A1X2H0E9_SYNRA|nr:hypothetical protein BCR43DRAFT_519021 [Syncephalastrum racemosum]
MTTKADADDSDDSISTISTDFTDTSSETFSDEDLSTITQSSASNTPQNNATVPDVSPGTEFFQLVNDIFPRNRNALKAIYNPDSQPYAVFPAETLILPPYTDVRLQGSMDRANTFALELDLALVLSHIISTPGNLIWADGSTFVITLRNNLHQGLAVATDDYLGHLIILDSDESPVAAYEIDCTPTINRDRHQNGDARRSQSASTISYDAYSESSDSLDNDQQINSMENLDHQSPEDKIQIDTTVPDDIKKKFLELMKEYTDIFDWDGKTLGDTTLIQHQIITKNVAPIRTRPYRLAPEEANALKIELVWGVICKLTPNVI